MTAAARLLRRLRHRLGDAMIAAGARLVGDVGPTWTPEREQHIRRAIVMARAVLDAEDAARERLRSATNGGESRVH